MEEILLNPGYHFIAQKILSNLAPRTLSCLSKTSKGIMKVCENVMIEKGRRKFIFKDLERQSCKDAFRRTFQDFVSFVENNEIFYHDYFKPLKVKREKEYILVQFLEKLTEFTKDDHLEQLEEQIEKSCKCPKTYSTHWFEIQRKIKLITNQYVKFIPSNCPIESRDHLMSILAFAISWEELDLVHNLLAALKNHDTCFRLSIVAYDFIRSADSYYIDRNDDLIFFMEKIMVQCKNPNSPNKCGSTAMHLVAELGNFKIAKILFPYCNNLDAKDQDGKTALDIANEMKHYRTVKILNSTL